MTYKIQEIEGIGPAFGLKLEAAAIFTTDELLDRASTKKGRAQIAAETGIPEALILKWANHADLFRINGVAGQFAELLEASGVDTVKELAHRVAVNLHKKLIEVNDAKNLTRRVPSEKELQKMIDQAKELKPVMTY
ncbi:MAG: DUF4332 domain-containing protein [Odoribacter sp.]|nr:DUF4332 domain-containing protein [Odoribacter sp.]